LITDERIGHVKDAKKRNELSKILKRERNNPPHYYYKSYPEGTLIGHGERAKY